MKLVSALLVLFLVGCKSSDKKESMNMPGAYKMLSVAMKNAKTDTSSTAVNQMKIYTDDFMMYATVNSPDSVSTFGIGSYSMNKDTVTENVIYSASDSASDDTLRHFNLFIEKTAKGYKQVIHDMGSGENKMTLTEDYESVGTSTKTSLDGAWKLVNRYTIKGNDTVNNNVVQYKTYNAGFVIWGNNWSDSLNKKHTGIGLGKFEMTGNKVKETMLASTYADVRGHDFDIDIELNGTDGFTQSMNNSDGTKSVEIYTRLKK